MRFKKHFKEEIEQDKLGSGPTRVGPAKSKALNMNSEQGFKYELRLIC